MSLFDSLRSRMLVIALVPIVGIAVATAEIAYEQYSTYRDLETIHPMISLATVGGDLVHELQKERGGTVGYLSSQGADAFKSRVADQRTLTDAALLKYRDTLSALSDAPETQRLRGFLAKANGSLEQLAAHRKKVDALSVGIPEHLKYYSAIIADLLNTPVIIEEMSPDGEITKHLAAMRALGWAKEKAGLERANGAALFNASMDPFPTVRHRVFVSLVGAQSAYLDEIQSFLTTEEAADWRAVIGDAAFDRYRDLQAVLLDLAGTRDTGDVKASDWFDVATTRIDALHRFYHRLSDDALKANDSKSAEQVSNLTVILAIQAAILLASLSVCWIVSRATLKPLLAVSSGLTRLTQGETDVVFERNSGGGREVRDLNLSAFTFVEALESQRRLQAEAEEHREQAEEQRRQALMNLADTIESATEAVVAKVLPITKGLVESSDDVSQSSLKVSEEAEGVAAAAEESLRNSEAMAGATDRLNHSAADIRQQVGEQRVIAQEAKASAEQTRHTVDGLNSAASRIEEVVTLIQGIAEQTNLLALNATIEAARAGDAGKGFAVVANEVKSLATQTGQATDDIRQQVEDMVQAMRSSVAAIGEINQVIERMATISEAVSTAIDDQSTVTSEISENVHQSTDASREVAQSIARVSNEAQSTRQIAQTNVTSTQEVFDLIETLQHQLNEIIRTSDKDVDRRRAPRVQLDGMRARLTAADLTHEVTVGDISTGGARVAGGHALRAGQPCRLEFPGRTPVEATIVEAEGGAARLTFVQPLPESDPLLRAA